MLKMLVLLGMLGMLASCSTVNVYVQNEVDVKTSWWPLGVKVESVPGAPGFRAETYTFGVSASGGECSTFAVGLVHTDCTVIDPSVCGLAIYDGSGDNAQLIEAAKRTFAHCQGE